MFGEYVSGLVTKFGHMFEGTKYPIILGDFSCLDILEVSPKLPVTARMTLHF